MLINENDEKFEKIYKTIMPGSTLAVHGINSSNGSLSEIALKILFSEGLITNRHSNFYFNCNVVGNEDNLSDALKYVYYNADGSYANLIIAIPKTITDLDDREYFVGNLPKSNDIYDQKHSNEYDNFLINEFIRKNGYIPREFIVGFVFGIEDENGLNEIYFANPHYLGLLDIDEQKEFGHNFINLALDEDKKSLVDINNISLEDLDRIIEVYKRFGENTEYFEQLREYKSNINSYNKK